MVTVLSVYMRNISNDVVDHQYRCVSKFLSRGQDFIQIQTDSSHPEALDELLKAIKSDIVIILDVDCIPVSERALPYLEKNASLGFLTGAIQRANHLSNGAHLYVGPFCMAFDVRKYRDLGSPSFIETYRGDVGEELTYRWQQRSEPLCFLYPSNVYSPQWDIDKKIKFGYGTTYQGMFYHQFCARDPEQQKLFIRKCSSILEEEKVTI
jgi:hypothetical protein